MSRWVSVQHSRSVRQCGICHDSIPVGDPYLWREIGSPMKFDEGHGSVFKLKRLEFRCMSCRPSREGMVPRSYRRRKLWVEGSWPRSRVDAALKVFIREATEDSKYDDWSPRDLYRHYAEWAGVDVMPPRKFTAALPHLGFRVEHEGRRLLVRRLVPKSQCADVHGAYVR